MSTRPCSFCEKTINKKSRHCPFCGGENKEETLHDQAICPRCDGILTHLEHQGTVLDSCPSCEGLWLDTREFNQLTSERAVYADKSIPYEYNRPPFPIEDGYLCYPLCSVLMTRKNFKKVSGVLIDRCRDHGIWLDADELDQIRCFIANGVWTNPRTGKS